MIKKPWKISKLSLKKLKTNNHMKLVLIYQKTDGYTYCCTIPIPFEYESKEKFVFDLLEKFNQEFWDAQEWMEEYKSCEIFGCTFSKFDFDTIEHNILTIDEWFEQYKERT